MPQSNDMSQFMDHRIGEESITHVTRDILLSTNSADRTAAPCVCRPEYYRVGLTSPRYYLDRRVRIPMVDRVFNKLTVLASSGKVTIVDPERDDGAGPKMTVSTDGNFLDSP